MVWYLKWERYSYNAYPALTCRWNRILYRSFTFVISMVVIYFVLFLLQGIRGVWIKLPITLSNLITPAVEVIKTTFLNICSCTCIT